MNKIKIKGIVIVIGIALTVLLRLLINKSPPIIYMFFGSIEYIIVGTLAFIFGWIAGIVGLLSKTITIILVAHKFNSVDLFLVILYGLYGFILGKITNIKLLNDKKNSIGYIGLFSLSAVILSFIFDSFYIIANTIFNTSQRISEIIIYIIQSTETIFDCVIVGIIIFILLIIYYKCINRQFQHK